MAVNEDTVEYAAINWLREIGYDHVHGEKSVQVSEAHGALPPKLVSGELRVGINDSTVDEFNID